MNRLKPPAASAVLALALAATGAGAGGPADPFLAGERTRPISFEEEVVPLLEEAVRLSGLPPLPSGREPEVRSVTREELRALVCGEDEEAQGVQCNGMQAAFDTERNRILVLEWGRQRGAEWESFVVHELVHALQHAQHGDAIYASCEAARATEQQAYAVQDAYLSKRSALLRVGSRMWWWHCPPAGTPAARRWDQR